ncbi:MAG: P-II family nitrogen regulator [Spirochaetaceae bacterium]|jgi:nitrogen regulatory protein PII|nr:P-II family nitrogen regulator [Spirochaetaceae bacterium]
MNDKKRVVLKLVFFIVDWSKVKNISSIFDQAHVRFHFVVKGEGTANSETLDMLGIGKSDKAVIICLEQSVMAPALLKEVGKKLGLHMPGTGIGFSVPLSGINAPILKVFKESVEKSLSAIGAREEGANNHQSGKGENMANEQTDGSKCDLIMAILNQGYSEEFMGVAREAGAGGGTVINGRGLMHNGPVKFFGISVQDEKEIIIILSTREKMGPIMEAVSKAFGIASKAEGIIFSMPAENIIGINLH